VPTVPEIDDETKTEALDVLTEILSWRMPDPQWNHIADLVETMASALTTGDAGKLRTATIDLELASPFRVTRIGATDRQSPPQKVQDRVNHLIHSLGGDSKGQEKPART
jgi:hypothetical protein